MLNLTKEYQFLSRSSSMMSNNGNLAYYLLLYGKTTANNTTGVHTVTLRMVLASTASNATFYQYGTDYNGKINGTTVFSGKNAPSKAWELSNFYAGDVYYRTGTVIAEGSLDIDCSNGLAKDITLSCYWSFNVNGASYTPAIGTNRGVSDTVTLPPIPRYATITSFTVTKRDETSVTVGWKADADIDWVWYSIDNGSIWKDLGVSNNVISGLSAGTTYNFKIRVKRTDNQLTTDSGTYQQTTYDYPHCTETPNFTIGNTLTLKLYNPLSRSVTVTGYKKEDDSWLFSGTTSGTVAEGFRDDYSVGKMYESIPNAKSGKYKVAVTYGNVTKTRDNQNTYSIVESECKPTVNGFTYKDSKTATVNITGDNQRIIRNNSNLLFTVGQATPKKSATISKYEVVFNGVTKSRTSVGDLDFGTVNLSQNASATLKVTDSRGLTGTKEISITIDDWVLPSCTTSLQRKNNFYTETYIKVDGTYSSLNGKNSITIQTQYKKVDDSSYSALQTLQENVQTTLQLDNTSEWNVKVIIKDRLGTTTYNLMVQRGMPIIYFDRHKLSVGVNCFPSKKESFELNGTPITEKNTNDNGTWCKLADGTMICRGYIPKSEFLTTTDYYTEVQGIKFYRSNAPIVTLPAEFATNGYSLSFEVINAPSGSRFMTPRVNGSKTETTFEVQLVGVEQWLSTGDAYKNLVEVRYTAIGTWK